MSSKPSDQELNRANDKFVAACTVISGPNGSGKSTLFELLEPVGEFVNADVIARGLNPQTSINIEILAAKGALDRLQDLLSRRQDFVFETTLSGHQPIALMERARDYGFQVGLVFVALTNADLNVKRVSERVGKGGHDIPAAIIRRRYPKSFANLAKAIRIAHGCLIYDNSDSEIELLLRTKDKTIEFNDLDESQPHHVLIAEAVAKVLALKSTAFSAQ